MFSKNPIKHTFNIIWNHKSNRFDKNSCLYPKRKCLNRNLKKKVIPNPYPYKSKKMLCFFGYQTYMGMKIFKKDVVFLAIRLIWVWNFLSSFIQLFQAISIKSTKLLSKNDVIYFWLLDLYGYGNFQKRCCFFWILDFRSPDAPPKTSDISRPNAKKMIQFLQNLFKKFPIK